MPRGCGAEGAGASITDMRGGGSSTALSLGQHSRTYLKIKSSGNPNNGPECVFVCVIMLHNRVTHIGHAYAQTDLVRETLNHTNG